jgi:hypothetical protein
VAQLAGATTEVADGAIEPLRASGLVVRGGDGTEYDTSRTEELLDRIGDEFGGLAM